MRYLAAAARDGLPHAAGALGAAALGLLLLLMAVVVRNRPGSRWHPWLIAGTLSFAMAMAIAIAAIHSGRLAVIRATGPHGPAGDNGGVYPGIQLQILGIALVGAIALTLFVVGALLGLRAGRGLGEPGRGQGWLGAAWLIPILPLATGALAYSLRLGRDISAVSLATPATKALRLFQAVEGAHVVLDWARLGLAVVGLVAVAVTIAGSRRAGDVRIPRWSKTSAVVLLAAGLAAFLSTRGHAADRAPLPLLSGGALETPRAQKLPRVTHCPHATRPAPLLEFEADGVRFNRTAVDLSKFQDDLESYRTNYPLLHEGHSPSVLLTVLAEPGTPVARIIPYLQRAGTGEILVAAAARRDHQSRTLGNITRFEFCGMPLRLTVDGEAMSRYGDWSRLVTAMDQGRTPFQVAAR
jgi:hypothetical protein